MLIEKYKPNSLGEIVGQEEAVVRIREWFRRWKPGGKALFLHGPAGAGKTSMMEAFSSEHDLDLVEINASDQRSAKMIRETIGSSVSQASLFRRGKIFVIDEIDALSGNSDRGGPSEIVKIIRETKHPVVLTANDPYLPKLSGVRKLSTMIQVGKVPARAIEKKLKHIAESEGVEIGKDVLRLVSERAEGDLRSAVTDLEVLIGKGNVTLSDVDGLGSRERGIDIHGALEKLFSSSTISEAKKSIDGLDMPLDDVFWWIETNLSREYKDPEELAEAFEALSRADLFRGRIRETGNWRLLAYMVDLMTGGVSSAKRKVHSKKTAYQYPTMIATLGRTRLERKVQDEKLEKFSEHLHCSKRKVLTEFLPYMKSVFE